MCTTYSYWNPYTYITYYVPDWRKRGSAESWYTFMCVYMYVYTYVFCTCIVIFYPVVYSASHTQTHTSHTTYLRHDWTIRVSVESRCTFTCLSMCSCVYFLNVLWYLSSHVVCVLHVSHSNSHTYITHYIPETWLKKTCERRVTIRYVRLFLRNSWRIFSKVSAIIIFYSQWVASWLFEKVYL